MSDIVNKGKIADNKDDAWNIQETYKDKPHGWIQWKGTNVCIEIYCACGTHGHIDDDFVYFVKCADCGRIYHVNGHVELIELKQHDGEMPVSVTKTFSDH